MAEQTKREQAKQKLAPIVEVALDPQNRNYAGVYNVAVKLTGEIVDLMMDGVKEELLPAITETITAGIIAGLTRTVQEFDAVIDQRIKDTVSKAMTAGGYVKGFR